MNYQIGDKTQESMNAGNWKEFIKIQLSTNSTFKILFEKVKAQYSSYVYKSKSICIQFIEALTVYTKGIIKEKLELAGNYSYLLMNVNIMQVISN